MMMINQNSAPFREPLNSIAKTKKERGYASQKKEKKKKPIEETKVRCTGNTAHETVCRLRSAGTKKAKEKKNKNE